MQIDSEYQSKLAAKYWSLIRKKTVFFQCVHSLQGTRTSLREGPGLSFLLHSQTDHFFDPSVAQLFNPNDDDHNPYKGVRIGEAYHQGPQEQPSEQPTQQPTEQPSINPTEQPSEQPTLQPTEHPSDQPSQQPTEQPSEQPTIQPTFQPTEQPTEQPSEQPKVGLY